MRVREKCAHKRARERTRPPERAFARACVRMCARARKCAEDDHRTALIEYDEI